MTHRTAVARLLPALAVELVGMLALLRTMPGIGTDDPLDVTGAIAARVGVALLAYLVVVTALQLLALALGAIRSVRGLAARLAHATSRIGPRPIAGVAAAAVIATGVTGCGQNPRSADALVVADRAPVVMLVEPAGAEPSTPDAPITMELEPTPPMSTDPPPPPEPAPPPRTIEVAPGDSFWSIAERELASRFGRTPTGAEISTYWHLVVEFNRSRLVDPANPNRIYAGQRFVLP